MSAPFHKESERITVRCYTDCWPYRTQIIVGSVDARLNGIEEISDLHYMLGRLLEHVKSKQERK